MMLDSWSEFVIQNFDTLMYASIGGFLLWVYRLQEHANRSNETKMGRTQYFLTHLVLFFWLPFLGALLAFLYLQNGDKLGVFLAIQIGLSAPAILDALVAKGINKAAQSMPVQITADQ